MTLIDSNLQGLKNLRLPDAKDEYLRQVQDISSHQLSFDERLGQMLDIELNARKTRRTKRRVKEAGLRVSAYKEEFSFSTPRGLSQESFRELCSLSFIKGAHNVVVAGPSGALNEVIMNLWGVKGVSCTYVSGSRWFVIVLRAKWFHVLGPACAIPPTTLFRRMWIDVSTRWRSVC